MQRPEMNPWLLHLAYKLLHNETGIISIMADQNPFIENPPKFIKADLFRYNFAPFKWPRFDFASLIARESKDPWCASPTLKYYIHCFIRF